MSGIIIDVAARTSKAEQDLAQINKSIKGIETVSKSTAESLGNLAKGFTAILAGGGALYALKNISSEFTNLSNKLKLVIDNTERLNKVQSQLYDLSEQTRGSIKGTVAVFSTFGKSIQSNTLSYNHLLKATKAVQQAVALSGANAQAADAAIYQLGQALSSGVLRGEELNSVMEQTPRIAKAIADGLGLTLGQLRLMAAEGKITSDVVFKSLLSQSKQLNTEFSKLTPTLDQGFSLLADSAKIFFNEFDKGLGLSTSLGSLVFDVAKSIKAASVNAESLGANLGNSLRTFVNNTKTIVVPLIDIFKTVGLQLIKLVPKGVFTKTLGGDIRELMRMTDDLAGGFFTNATRLFQFAFVDIIQYDSEVEKAIKRIRRLLPTVWVTGGFDIQTIQRFFSTKTLNEFGVALVDLSNALKANFTSIFTVFDNVTRRLGYFGQEIAKYIGLIPDTVIAFRIDDIGAAIYSISELLRGVLNIKLTFLDLGKLMREVFSDAYVRFVIAMEDIAVQLPLKILDMLFSGIAKIPDALAVVRQIIVDFFKLNAIEALLNPIKLLGKAYSSIVKPMKEVSGLITSFAKVVSESSLKLLASIGGSSITQKLNKTIQSFRSFSKAIIDFFKDIYIEVIGNSWWTDTIAGVVDSSKSLLKNTKSGLQAFGNYVLSLFESINKNAVINSFTNIFDNLDFNAKPVTFDINKLLDTRSFESSLAVISNFFNSIVKQSSSSLAIALNSISIFGNKVISVFENIYNKVIGNSWWTDTIDTIVFTSNTLWSKVSGGFDKFQKGFTKIFTGDFKLETFFEDKSVVDSAQSLFLSVVEKAKEVFSKVPTLLKTYFVGALGGVLFGLFTGASLAGAITHILVSTLAIIASNLFTPINNIFSDRGLATNLGLSLGKFIGTYLSNVIKEIPFILRTALGFVSGFVRGLLSEITLIGPAFKSVFAIGDAIGISGPIGLIGAWLFGSNLVGLLGSFDKTKSFSEFFSGKFDLISKTITGKGDGVLSKFFFGSLGPERGLAAIALALDTMGIFDDLFGSSQLAQYGTKAGILYTLITGKDGVNKIVDTVGSKIIAPISTALQSGLKSITKNTSLYDVFFSTAGNWQDRASVALKSILDRLSVKIVDFAAPYASKASDFIKTLLFGTNPDQTIKSIKEQVITMYNATADYITKGLEKIKNSKALQPLFEGIGSLFEKTKYNFWLLRKAGAKGAVEDVASTALEGLSSASKRAAAIGGANGLVGRAFLGKFGKAAVIGAIASATLLLASAANASELDKGVNTDTRSAFQSTLDTWNSIKLKNPMTAVALEITAVSIPLILGALYMFRAQVASLIASAFTTSAIGNFTSSVLSNISLLSKNFKTLGSQLAFVSVAAFAAYKVSDGDLMITTLAAGLAQSLAVAFRKQIAAVFGFRAILGFISAIIGGIFSLAGAVIIGSVAVLGIIGAWLFGDKEDGVIGTLSKVYDRILKIIGLRKQIDTASALPEESAKFAKSRSLDVNYSTKDINFSKLNDSQKANLDKYTSEMNTLIQKSISQEDETGVISSELRIEISDMNAKLAKYTEALVAKTTFDFDSADKFFKQMQEEQSTTRLDDFVNNVEQTFLDILFSVQNAALKGSRAINPLKVDKAGYTKQLAELESQRNTTYSATYVSLTTQERELRDLYNTARTVTQDLTPEIAKSLDELNTSYQGAFNNLQSLQSSFFSSDEQIATAKKLKQEIEKAYISKLTSAIQYATLVKDAALFRQSLTNIDSSLKKIGITVDTSTFFAKAGSENIFKAYADEAENLAKQILLTRNVAERNRIQIRIEEIRTVLNRQVEDASQLPKSNIGNLKENLDKVGISGYSTATLASISEAQLQQLQGYVQRLQDLQAAAALANPLEFYKKPSTGRLILTQDGKDNLKFFEDYLNRLQKQVAKAGDTVTPIKLPIEPTKVELDQVKSLVKELEKANGLADTIDFSRLYTQPSGTTYSLPGGITEGILKDSKKLTSNIKNETKNIEVFLANVAGKAKGLSDVAKDIAAKQGVTIPIEFESKNSTKRVKLLDSKLRELNATVLKAGTNAKEYGGKVKDLNNEIESILRPISSFNTMLGMFSSGSAAVTANDLLSIDSKTYSDLRNASKILENIDITLNKEGSSQLSLDTLKTLLEKRTAQYKVIQKAYLETLYSTPAKLNDLFRSNGIQNTSLIADISPEVSKQLIAADRAVRELKFKLEDPSNVSKFQDINNELYEAERTADKLRFTLTSSFKTVLDTINEAFATGLSKEEFSLLPKDIQLRLADDAKTLLQDLDDKLNGEILFKAAPQQQAKLKDDSKISSEVTLPVVEVLSGTVADYFQNMRQKIFEANKLVESSSVKAIDAIKRIPFMNLSDMSNKIIEAFPNIADFRLLIEKLPQGELDALVVKAIEQLDRRTKAQAGRLNGVTTTDIAKETTAKTAALATRLDPRIAMKIALDEAKVPVELAALNFTTEATRLVITNLTEKLIEATANVPKATTDQERIAAQNIVNGLKEQLALKVLEATRDVGAVARETGRVMASSISDNFSAAFTDFAKRGFTDLASFKKTVADNIASSIIDAFMKGLLDPITGSEGVITRAFKSLGASLFSVGRSILSDGVSGLNKVGTDNKSIFESSFNWFKDLFKSKPIDPNMLSGISEETSTAAAIAVQTSAEKSNSDKLGTAFSSGFKTIGEFFKTGFNTISQMFTNVFTYLQSNLGPTLSQLGTVLSESFSSLMTTLSSLFTTMSAGGSSAISSAGSFLTTLFAATGGQISGPGNGTSDDIPAMLSNGEFVVNARSTKRYSKLLHAINSGGISKFAEGGMVAGSIGLATTQSSDVAAPTDTTDTTGSTTDAKLDAILSLQMVNQSLDNAQVAGLTASIEKLGTLVTSGFSSLNTSLAAISLSIAMQTLTMAVVLPATIGALISASSITMMTYIGTFLGIIQAQLTTLTAISSIPFLATGGRVMGPGTGTSDSIPAMLSNGEYVINADSTRKHLGLLQQINSGGLKKFAAGGLVSTAMIATPTFADVPGNLNKDKPQASASQQVFNINITGDISKQTKTEIMKMIPQLTASVNAQNREKLYRRS